jgi:hypothetical protein
MISVTYPAINSDPQVSHLNSVDVRLDVIRQPTAPLSVVKRNHDSSFFANEGPERTMVRSPGARGSSASVGIRAVKTVIPALPSCHPRLHRAQNRA